MQYIKNQYNFLKDFVYKSNNTAVKKYFDLLGFKYSSLIPNNNFFHFAVEAYIITIIKENVDKIEEDKLYLLLLQTPVKEEEFIENVNFFIGNPLFSSDEVKISTVKISSLFLDNINCLRKKVGNKEINAITDSDSFFRYAVSATIHELNNTSNKEDKLGLFWAYNKLHSQEKDFGVTELAAEYEKEIVNQINKKNAYAASEVYFNFCEYKVKTLIEDIVNFNHQNASVVHLSFAILKCQFLSKGNLYMNKAFKSSEKQIGFISSEINSKISHAKDVSFDLLTKVNTFISDKYKYSKDKVKQTYPSVYEKIEQANKNYFVPLQGRFYTAKDNSYAFIVNSYSKGKSSLFEAKEAVVKIVSEKYNQSYEVASKYVHLSVDKLGKTGVIQVLADKTNLSKKDLEDMLINIHSYIKQFNYAQLKEYAAGAYSFGKTKVLESYERFLGIKEEETKKEESGIKEKPKEEEQKPKEEEQKPKEEEVEEEIEDEHEENKSKKSKNKKKRSNDVIN